MSIFSRLNPFGARAAVQEKGAGRSITTPEELAAAISEAMGTGPGAPVNESSAMRTAAYYGCVRILSGAPATLPFHVKKKVDARTREDVDDHAVATLFRKRPNRFTRSPVSFIRMITAHKLNAGNFYAQIVRSPVDKRITDLQPLNPFRMDVKQARDGEVVYEYAGMNGVRQVFAPRDIFHVMGPTIDGLKGLSVLSYARETLGESIAARAQGVAMFRNGLRTPGTIVHPGKLGPQGVDNVQSSVADYQPGGKKEDKVMVFEEGMKFMPYAMNPVDAQWIEARQMTRVEIAMFFGVPPFMLGDTEKSTSFGTGLEEMSAGFVNFTLMDHIRDLADAIDAQLIDDPTGQIYCHIDTNGLLRGDFEKRMKGYAIGRQWSFLSSNDIRAKEDMNPREGGDDDYLIPSTHVIAGEPAVADPAPAASAPPVVNVFQDGVRAGDKRRERVTVTEHDEHGRIKSFVKEEVNDG